MLNTFCYDDRILKIFGSGDKRPISKENVEVIFL